MSTYTWKKTWGSNARFGSNTAFSKRAYGQTSTNYAFTKSNTTSAATTSANPNPFSPVTTQFTTPHADPPPPSSFRSTTTTTTGPNPFSPVTNQFKNQQPAPEATPSSTKPSIAPNFASTKASTGESPSFKSKEEVLAEAKPSTGAKFSFAMKKKESPTDKPAIPSEKKEESKTEKKEEAKKEKKTDKIPKKVHRKKISNSIPNQVPFFPQQPPSFNFLPPQPAPLSIESFENEILDDADRIISQIFGTEISEEEKDQFGDRLLEIVKKHLQTCISLNKQNPPQGQIGPSFNQFGRFGLNSPFMNQNFGYGQMSQGMFPQNMGFNQQFMNQGMMRPF